MALQEGAALTAACVLSPGPSSDAVAGVRLSSSSTSSYASAGSRAESASISSGTPVPGTAASSPSAPLSAAAESSSSLALSIPRTPTPPDAAFPGVAEEVECCVSCLCTRRDGVESFRKTCEVNPQCKGLICENCRESMRLWQEQSGVCPCCRARTGPGVHRPHGTDDEDVMMVVEMALQNIDAAATDARRERRRRQRAAMENAGGDLQEPLPWWLESRYDTAFCVAAVLVAVALALFVFEVKHSADARKAFATLAEAGGLIMTSMVLCCCCASEETDGEEISLFVNSGQAGVIRALWLILICIVLLGFPAEYHFYIILLWVILALLALRLTLAQRHAQRAAQRDWIMTMGPPPPAYTVRTGAQPRWRRDNGQAAEVEAAAPAADTVAAQQVAETAARDSRRASLEDAERTDSERGARGLLQGGHNRQGDEEEQQQSQEERGDASSLHNGDIRNSYLAALPTLIDPRQRHPRTYAVRASPSAAAATASTGVVESASSRAAPAMEPGIEPGTADSFTTATPTTALSIRREEHQL